MNFTETYQKIKSNISVQNALKDELETRRRELSSCEAGIEETKRMLDGFFEERKDKEEISVEKLSNLIKDLDENLKSEYLFKQSGAKHFGLFFYVLGKKLNLLDNEVNLLTSSDIDSNIINLFDRYQDVGEAMFNADEVARLQKIKHLHEESPAAVENKMVNVLLSKKAEHYKNNKLELTECLSARENELELVNAELSGLTLTRIINRLSGKEEKFQERRAEIIEEMDSLKNKIKEINAKITDKATSKEEAIKQVKSDLKAVENVLAWIKMFRDNSLDLAMFTNNYIDHTQGIIKRLESKKDGIASRINEIQVLIRLNKKNSNDIMLNVFNDNSFIKNLKSFEFDKTNEEDVKTVKFINGKYDEYIKGEVQALVD